MSREEQLIKSYIVLFEFLLASKRRVMDLGAECELTAMQTTLLFLLDSARPMHEFKTIFNCDASNVTGIVDGLEQKGLTTREDSTEDRRIKLIKLTKKGEKTRTALLQKFTSDDSPFLSKLSVDELDTLNVLLQKVTDGTSTYDQRRSR